MILRFSLHLKILLALAGLLALFGGTVALLIKSSASATLRHEVEKRGISIAKHIAQTSIDEILARNRLALRITAARHKKTEEDILYIYFLGSRRDNVLAHSFGETFPTALLGINPLAPGREYSVRQLMTEQGMVYDIAVPVAQGGLGEVHLGISTLPVERAVGELSREVLAVMLLVTGAGLLLAVPLSAAIVRPVRQLTVAAEAVAGGDLERQVPANHRDEIGQLAKAFNHMLAELRKAREALLAGNRELANEVFRRQQAEDQLAAQLNFLSTLMDAIPSPIFFKDKDFRFLGCNRAFEEFLGKSRSELVGRPVGSLFQLETELEQELLHAGGSRKYTGQLTRADGAVREVVVHKAAFRGSDDKPAGMVGIVLDVTAEREIERLRREFVSTAAHEFQTPLTAILGYCELLLDTSLPEESRREYLEIIQERGEFISRLVDQLLDVARIEAGQRLPIICKPCQPERVIAHSLRACGKTTDGHRFELTLPAACPPVVMDEDRILQVMNNLLGNAVKYSAKGSLIRVVGEISGRWFTVSIEDQGQGMHPDQLERIFDKFYRVESHDSAPSGTGLGLYITKTIVEAHGGLIEAESAPGRGTRMRFALPLATAAAGEEQLSG